MGVYASFVEEVLMKFYGQVLNTLATNIPKFNDLGRLKFDYTRIANERENLLSILKANNAKYHNTCQLSYSESKLKRFQLPNEKQLAKACRRKA